MRLNLILIGIIVVLLGSCYFLTSKYRSEKKIRIEKEFILQSKEVLFKNDSAQNASKVITWSLKYDELKDANKRALNGMASDYDKKLAGAYNNIELYKRKNKDLQRYTDFLLQAKDTIYQPMPADCQLKPIKTKFIKIDFIYKDSLVGVSYDYQTGVNTLVSLYPKLKSNGKKHWPNWGFLPWVGWDNTSITTAQDPKASIINQISIEFKK